MPIYVICDYYIHQTDLVDVSSFNFFFLIFTANIEISFPLESGNLQLGQTKFPVFWQHFQIPCVFPDRDFFYHFPCAVGTLNCVQEGTSCIRAPTGHITRHTCGFNQRAARPSNHPGRVSGLTGGEVRGHGDATTPVLVEGRGVSHLGHLSDSHSPPTYSGQP